MPLFIQPPWALRFAANDAWWDAQRWRDLVIETDPDIIIGYNICNFDLPYLIKRAETLKVHDFPYWGRNRKMCALALPASFVLCLGSIERLDLCKAVPS